MPVEQIETLVIGGGQAGLAMSHRLKQRGLPHLVLERYRIAERWRSERWDGLKFQFPNWSVRLPDFPFAHTDPDGFATTAEILDYITAYADFVAPPIRCGVAVTRLRCRDGGGFVAETPNGPIDADNVVVATGPYQRAVIPDTPARKSFLVARCWWSARGRPARRLQRNFCARAGASISRSASTTACRAAIAAAT
jgi:putative flavoprotein involved in K+ transport